ncbi:hypothetical protein JCM10296v2_005276 [Rhodotorula toruloides]
MASTSNQPDKAQEKKHVILPLSRAAPDQVLNLRLILHFLALVLPQIFIVLPARIFVTHVLLRWRSPIVRVIGRPALADYVSKLAQFILSRCHTAQVRIVFDRVRSYKLVQSGPYFKGCRDWVTKVEVNGTAGRWIALPGTRREEDDVVLFFVHGGGFVVDTGSNAQDILLHVTKTLNLKKHTQASVFCLDYRLAPEYKYPSQLIETLAGYHYLVNTLGISEDKIVIAGDSAGGNIATAFLLHLARPNPEIYVPEELGPTPKRPAGALLISPFINLASRSSSSFANPDFDFIDLGGGFRAACDYVGVYPPPGFRFPMPSYHPRWHFKFPHPHPPTDGRELHTQWGWAHCEGIEKFNSPYVNPIVCQDADWWKEACPGDGRTVVTWGGKEIFADDDEAFFKQLEKSGVKPAKLVKKFGAHDWILHDWSVPLAWKTKSKGPDKDFYFGMNAIVDLLSRIAKEAKESPSVKRASLARSPSWASRPDVKAVSPESAKSSPSRPAGPTLGSAPTPFSNNKPSAPSPEPAAGTDTYATTASHDALIPPDAPVLASGEGDILTRSTLGDSGVIVEKASGKAKGQEKPKPKNRK